jgi:ubiquinone biosynthesis protein UbiJ
VEDYKLLEALNATTGEKLQALSAQAAEARAGDIQLVARTAELKPFLDQIDTLDTSVEELGNTAQAPRPT